MLPPWLSPVQTLIPESSLSCVRLSNTSAPGAAAQVDAGRGPGVDACIGERFVVGDQAVVGFRVDQDPGVGVVVGHVVGHRRVGGARHLDAGRGGTVHREARVRHVVGINGDVGRVAGHDARRRGVVDGETADDDPALGRHREGVLRSTDGDGGSGRRDEGDGEPGAPADRNRDPLGVCPRRRPARSGPG